MTTESTTGSAAVGERRQRPAPRRAVTVAAAKATAAPKESLAEEILHEIFRSQGMDLRESSRTRGLVTDLFKAIAKEAK